ncbi:MFS transporter [Pseudomonas guariconensis]|uniref:MFS transporter n=1 Tax=Pseudomonas TaxID=286 RepID=UPI0020976BC2|nr:MULTISPECIES: MFS transporter [Pseudomonas]MCO7640085.1 MFS transporter [Pseudomonas sp. S 311-6]MCO7514490.1 MFS transporter [Pseudomonas putida]MCO7565454.1 MFS transporter [Pseudomonas mosselii]MCO7604543.1 MFS transporter [Pseudomonas guariconensis]MCO7616662.1 MFS transporter [Pseudomonas guariconensis]
MPAPHEVSPATLRRVIAASAIGNFVEWFDFAVYGFLATLIASQFFASGDASVALLKTFAVFAVAFALRPLGGIVFGALGDRLGRKRILSLTILLMAGSTTLIGLLPTYASIGLAAPALLTLARCLQGFSAGGEYAGACAYLMEHAPNDKRAFYGSFVPVSTFSAFACAAVIAYALEASLSPEAMNAWGWRIPFLVAAPLGLVGLYLRWRMEETPAFREAMAQGKQGKEHAHSPLKETLRHHGRAIRNLGAFISLTALSFYMFTTYFSTYLQMVGNLTRAQSLLVSTVALLFAAVGCPLAGAFSDRVGRRRTIGFTCLWVMVAVFPAYWLASSGSLSGALLGVILLAIGALLSGVVTAALLSESFPTRTRYTASAITYNVAYTLFGGTAPLVATWLISQTGSSLAPAFYLVVIALVALVGGLALPETSRISLHDESCGSQQPQAVKELG